MDIENAVLPYGDPDPEVQQQTGESASGRNAYRRDGDEQNERADEQEFIELVDSQRAVPSLARLPDRSSSGRYFVTLPNL
ncbi:hypothetical protein [Streptomyces sp. NPDC002994]|uniref:hypothetical protein n=1 Tax=Streptomyces sp. NPDC002994 TaxID=3154441 RepID=UPI0033ACB221